MICNYNMTFSRRNILDSLPCSPKRSSGGESGMETEGRCHSIVSRGPPTERSGGGREDTPPGGCTAPLMRGSTWEEEAACQLSV